MALRHACLASILACILRASAGAELLRYTDDKGTVHFVASEDEIPARYRHQAQRPESGTLNQAVDPGGAKATHDALSDRLERMRALQEREERARKAEQATRTRERERLERAGEALGAEPRKYRKDCQSRASAGNGRRRCDRILTDEWIDWDRRRQVHARERADFERENADELWFLGTLFSRCPEASHRRDHAEGSVGPAVIVLGHPRSESSGS